MRDVKGLGDIIMSYKKSETERNIFCNHFSFQRFFLLRKQQYQREFMQTQLPATAIVSSLENIYFICKILFHWY